MRHDSDTGLPASIEFAWGLRQRPNKGPRRGLSLERIVAAAVQVAESDGTGAISMGRIAAMLGASTMSLYRYMAAKDELLALMVDAVYGTPPATLSEGDWRTRLSKWAWTQHGIFRQHAWALRIAATIPPSTPNQIAWLEAGLACLRDTPLAEGEKLSVILLVGNFVRSEASLVAEINETFQATDSTSTQGLAEYGRLLMKLTSPDQFPALQAVISAGVFEQEDHPSSEFAFGLARVLDGVETLVCSYRVTSPADVGLGDGPDG